MVANPKQSNTGTVGRRSAARLRMGIPATLLLLTGTHRGTLLDLSCTGARLLIEPILRVGADAVLQAPGFEAFGTLVWCEQGRVGMRFDRPLREDWMIAMRDYIDTFPERTRETMLRSAREWVSGSDRLL